MCKLTMLAAAATVLLVAVGPALAQTTTTSPYPGPTVTTAAPTSPNIGVLGVSQSRTASSCGFVPGAQLSLVLDGQGGATDTADPDGCARSTITVISPTQIRIEGFTFRPNSPAANFCGSNTLATSGAASAGGTRTVNTTFSVDCPAGGTLPRTGAMVLRWSLVGGALLGVGALLVLAQRRRTTSSGD